MFGHVVVDQDCGSGLNLTGRAGDDQEGSDGQCGLVEG
jgi:hypothetical protein